jgi:Mce-associated membrane protein
VSDAPETSKSKSWLVPSLLVVLIVALVASSLVIRSKRGTEVDPGMLVAARLQANNFFSLDYRHAGDDVDRVLALSTGTFKKQYAARRTEVISGVTKQKLVVTASIPKDGAAVEFVDATHGRVLVAVDVSTSNAANATPTANRYRTRILLTKVKGHWLVSGLNQVG